MRRSLPFFFSVIFVLAAVLGLQASTPAPATTPEAKPEAVAPASKDVAPEAAKPRHVSVVVVPVREQIGDPILYIIRRGLKEAIAAKVDVVVLDMKTPGGALDTTFEIMEALSKFPGETITYINTEAISAGAFISATTSEIWFAPGGVIGAAAPVLSGGQDVEATMKQKIVSYLKARVRATSEGKGYRGQVISAMIDADYELKIGDKVIKNKGELLSLTATEACQAYGDPSQPLLGAGIAPDIGELLAKKYGAGNYSIKRLEVTWSEQLAVWLNAIAPVLLGLGVVALFIEFKTPGFGVFGVAGILLLAVVFLGSYIAGLSGHEPILFFGVGLVLVAAEFIFMPGVVVLALTGLLLMFGSLLWAMADLWPHEPFTFSGDTFVRPLANLGMGLGLAMVLALLVLRFLPRSWFWDRLIVAETVSSSAQAAGSAPASALPKIASLVGRTGVAATALRPGGQVEVDGQRFEAKVEVGHIDAGEKVLVVSRTDFGLIVERIS